MIETNVYNPAIFHPVSNVQALASATTSIDAALDSYGPETVGNAATIVGLRAFGESLKDVINSSSLPQSVKEAAIAYIDAQIARIEGELAVPSDVVDAVAETEEGAEMAHNCCCAATEAGEQATEASEGSPSSESASGSSGAAPSTPAEAEASAEEANESVGGSGGADTSQDVDSAQQAAQERADEELNAVSLSSGGDDDKKKGSRNFLIVLAEAMGKTQGAFLQNALDAQTKMAGIQEDVANKIEGSAQAFTTAQTEFSAQMQMFNLYSNQVATGIKTIGEALAGIARKQ